MQSFKALFDAISLLRLVITFICICTCTIAYKYILENILMHYHICGDNFQFNLDGWMMRRKFFVLTSMVVVSALKHFPG